MSYKLAAMGFKLEEFFFDTPIYTKVTIDETEIGGQEFQALFYSLSARDVEGFNPFQGVQTTFRISEALTAGRSPGRSPGEGIGTSEGGIGTIVISCKRYHDKCFFLILWNAEERIIQKIGQYPSVADFHLTEVKEYKKVISEEKLRELTRAIGLAANGVGIGSFVYLRRIFEHLINEAFVTAKSEGSISEGDFQRARMEEKIDMLHSYLPSFLVENKGIYSILSLGIHELDEQTCLSHFDVLRVGIEIILDEKLDEQRKREKTQAAKDKLSALKGGLKK